MTPHEQAIEAVTRALLVELKGETSTRHDERTKRAAALVAQIALVAQQTGISKPTLWRWAKLGRIKLYRQGSRMTFVSVAEVQGWIENGRNEGVME